MFGVLRASVMRLVSLVAAMVATMAPVAGVCRADDPTEPLRRTTVSLIPALGEARIEPPFRSADLSRCTSKQLHAPWLNPFSSLSGALRARHMRLTQVTGPSRVSFRDSLLVDTGHRISFDIIPEHKPRLEFGWRALPCGDRRVDLVIEVTVADRHGARVQRVPLVPSEREPSENGRTYRQFDEFSLDLALAPGQPAVVSIALLATSRSGRGEPATTVALAEPAITGIPHDDDDVVAASPGVPPLPPGSDLNLLWIVIDAVRHDALGPGRSFDAPGITPALDRIFAEGTAFAKAYTLANQTRTSTVAMLQSAAPSMGGFHSNTWSLAGNGLKRYYASDPPTLPRILEKAGWRVAHFGHNFFLFAGEDVGIDHGFPHGIDFTAIPSDAVEASRAAMRYFEDNQDRRWALLLNYTAPHTPYMPPEAFIEKAARIPGPDRLGGLMPRNYIGELMWVDHNLKPVFERLDALGLTERTLVIVTADHGEVMSPAHDCFSSIVGQPCGFNHSLTLYNDELHVPLAMRLPGRIAAGHVVSGPISHADLAPTILDVLGLPPEPRHAGRSQRAALAGGEAEPSPIVADGRMASAIIHDGWKLIVHASEDDIAPRARLLGEGTALPRRELFDLGEDPGETRNLAVREKDRTEAMVETLKKVRVELGDIVANGRKHMPAVDGAPVATPTAEVETMRGEPVVARLFMAHSGGLAYSVRVVEADGSVPAVAPLLGCVGAAPLCALGASGALSGNLQGGEAERDTATFRIDPAAFERGRRLAWELSVDGKSLDPKSIRLGRFGIAFFARETVSPSVSELFGLAESSAKPYAQPRESAVYLTMEGARPETVRTQVAGPAVPRTDSQALETVIAPEDAVYDRRVDERLGRDMRRVLRELGYSR